MSQIESSKSILEELYTLPEDKIQEVKDFIHFLKYKSDLDLFPKSNSEPFNLNPRQGWEKFFRSMAEKGDDSLIDKDLTESTSWDKEEWEWK